MAKRRVTSWQNPTAGVRNAEYLAVPTARGDISGSTAIIFDRYNWTIGFWFKPTSSFIVGETYYLWHAHINPTNYWAMKIGGDAIPYFDICSGGSTVSSYNAADTALIADNWYFLAAFGDLDNFTMTINGVVTTTNTIISYTLPAGTLPTYMYLGSDYNGANQPNGNYSDYIILPYKATIDQLYGYVVLNRPFSPLPRLEVSGTLIDRPDTNPLICDGSIKSIDAIEASLQQRYKANIELTETPSLLAVLTTEQEESGGGGEGGGGGSGQTTYKIIGYVNENTQSAGVDATKLTHLYWAFAEPNPAAGQYIKPLESWQITYIQYAVNTLRNTINPSMKVILAVGGWGAGGSSGGQGNSGFETAMSTAAYRAQFASDCNYLMNLYNLDGIDIDCEYPAAADKTKFTQLMQAIRDAIGWNKYLSIAIPAGSVLLGQSFDLAALKNICDCINIMAYDFTGTGTQHHSNLYVSTLSTAYSCELAVNYCKTLVPVGQLTLGVPFYGYVSGVGSKSYDNTTSTDLVGAYINLNGYTRYWDDTARVPYLKKTGTFQCAYDDSVSLAIKAQYIKDQGLGGVMIWQLMHEISKTLLTTLYNALV